MASAGFEPANLGTKGQHATSRPPKLEMPDSVVHPLLYHKNAPKGDYFGKGKCIFTRLSLMQQSRTGEFYFQVVNTPL